jgi:hypothetical protein
VNKPSQKKLQAAIKTAKRQWNQIGAVAYVARDTGEVDDEFLANLKAGWESYTKHLEALLSAGGGETE